MPSILTEDVYAGEALLSEAAGMRSRDVGVIDQNQTLGASSVLAQVSHGALSAAGAVMGPNTGNPAFSAVTAAATAQIGDYVVEMVDPTHFDVRDTGGVELGHGVLGTAFTVAGHIGFTLTAGGTACVAGDSFKVTVSAAAAANVGRYVAYNPSATDGSQNACAVLFHPVTTAAGATAKRTLFTRACEWKAKGLQFAAGVTAQQQAAALAQLAALGIVARS